MTHININKRAETAMKRRLGLKLANALVTARHYAQATVNVDTGDLRDSIRVLPPEVVSGGVVSGLAAGGIFGQRRGQMIDYARTIEERYGYLRPAMALSGWERGLHE